MEPVTATIRLGDIAHARSGDKGNHANVGVIAYTDTGFAYLKQILTETRIAEFFLPFRPRQVDRYELPGIRGLNFVLHNILAGGASESLKSDNQGKTLALAILEMSLPRPADLESMKRVQA